MFIKQDAVLSLCYQLVEKLPNFEQLFKVVCLDVIKNERSQI